MVLTSFPLRVTRTQLAKTHPYFCGNQTVKAQTPVTTAADDDGRTTLPAALRRLLQLLKSSTNGPQKSTEVVALLRNNPQLMAAFIQQRNILANKPNPPCVVANPQQQVGASNGNSTTIATHQTLQVTGNICSTTQQRMMTGGTMIVAQPPPQISRSSDFPATIHQQSTNQLDNLVVASSYGHVSHLETRSSTGSPVNINQCSRSAIDLPPNQENGGRRDIGKRVGSSGVANWVVASQLAVARQLIMQAAISVAAAGATNFSQILNDQTHSIEHVVTRLFFFFFYLSNSLDREQNNFYFPYSSDESTLSDFPTRANADGGYLVTHAISKLTIIGSKNPYMLDLSRPIGVNCSISMSPLFLRNLCPKNLKMWVLPRGNRC